MMVKMLQKFVYITSLCTGNPSSLIPENLSVPFLDLVHPPFFHSLQVADK